MSLYGNKLQLDFYAPMSPIATKLASEHQILNNRKGPNTDC